MSHNAARLLLAASLCLGAPLAARGQESGSPLSLHGQTWFEADWTGAKTADSWAYSLNARPQLTLRPSSESLGVLRLDASLGGAELSDASITVPEAYLVFEGSSGPRFGLGKRRIVWGRTQLFNLSYFFESATNPADTNDDPEGIPLARLVLMSGNLSVEALVTGGSGLADTGIGARCAIAKLLPETDASLVGYWSDSRKLCLGLGVETSPLAQADFLSDLCLYFEGGLSQTAGLPELVEAGSSASLSNRETEYGLLSGDAYARIAAGLRFTVPLIDAIAMGEFAYRSDGYTADEISTLEESGLIWSCPSNLVGLSRDCVLAGLYKEGLTVGVSSFTDSLSASATLLANPLDGSGMAMLSLSSSAIQEAKIELWGAWYFGATDNLWRAGGVHCEGGARATIGF
jgi:hypothetical protein